MHTRPPRVEIVEPRDSSMVEGIVPVYGSARVDDMDHYEVQYGIGEAPISWGIIVRQNFALEDGILAAWDTRELRNGLYSLRVVIYDRHGNHAASPVVETMRGADLVLMVTKPTSFGLHDLRLAVQVAHGELQLPVAVVINRDGVGDDGVERFCNAEGVPILMRIPLDRRIAEAYAEGQSIIEALSEYQPLFQNLYRCIVELESTRRGER